MRVCGLVLTLWWTVALSAQQPQRPPNIVLVVADDLGYGDLGCYGQQHIRTPHLDGLAAAGMRFVQHYAGAPVCAPSRCVLMTGVSSGRASIRDNQEHQPEGQLPLGKDEVTLAEMLAARGYATGCFGKWGLGYPGSAGEPRQQGFLRFYGYNCQRHAHGYYPAWLWDDGEQRQLAGNDGGATGAQYSADVITDAACAFVRAQRQRPFFLYAPFTLPHLALQVPAASLAAYRDAFDETPYTGKSYLPHPTPRACYAAMVSHLDACVGRLLHELENCGLTKDTLVLFTSDNGPTHLRAQVDFEFFASSGKLRGEKGSVYEGGIRVPLLARWPGQVPAGCSRDLVCAFQDVLPTIAAIAGGEVPALCDGESFLPTLRGEAVPAARRDFLLWDCPGYGGQIAVRSGRWKGVWRGLRANPDAVPELFDLEVDPGERRDLANAEPIVLSRLRQYLATGRRQPAVEAFRFGRYGTTATTTAPR